MCAQISSCEYAVHVSAAFSDRRISSNRDCPGEVCWPIHDKSVSVPTYKPIWGNTQEQPTGRVVDRNLSSSSEHSVNDSLPRLPYSVQYVTLEEFIEGVMVRGQCALMVKFDGNQYLLGMRWKGAYYIDMASI